MLFLAILLFSSVFACSGNDGSVELFLVRSPLVEEDPLDPSLVTHIRVHVTGPGMVPTTEIYPFEAGGTSTLPNIITGKDRVITVEGLNGEDGYAVSRGRSLPISIDEGRDELELFIARINRFSLTPGYGLEQARFGHITMLTDQGYMAVIGGAASGTHQTPSGILSSIEIYDPTSGQNRTLSCSGEAKDTCQKTPRAHAAVVPIDSGTLLLSGIGTSGTLSDAELIHPSKSDVISSPHGTSAARSQATVVQQGTLSYIAGGKDPQGNATDAFEIVHSNGDIEPITLPSPKWAMAGASLSNFGFFFGGFDANDQISPDLLLFNGENKTFAPTATDIEGRAFARAISLPDNRVLVIGGLDDSGQSSTRVDLYDSSAGAFCHIGNLQRGRWLFDAVVLPDGRVLTVGGLTGRFPGTPTSEAEILDPRFVKLGENCSTGSGVLSTFRVTNMGVPRFAPTALLLPNGTVAVVGGIDHLGKPIKQIEVFLPDE